MSDYISRDDLLERLGIDDLDCTKCSWGDRNGFVCKRGCDFQDACEAIEDAEPADVVPMELYQRALSDVVTLSVERKKGKWIRVTEELGESWMCSECMEEFIPHDGMEEFASYAHFCPNCGTQMGDE